MNLPIAASTQFAAPNLSNRYVHINTQEIISRMSDEGFYIATARSTNPRTRDPLFAKHSIEFRHQDAKEINGVTPRVIFVNSHDGSSTARFMAGLYRFICSNGLVIGKTIAEARQRHAGDAAADLIWRMREMAKRTERAFSQIERWYKIQLTAPQRNQFATIAAQLRWGDAHMYSAEEILTPRRAEDDHGDLWSTYNIVQENTVRGGLSGLSRSGRRATSRPLADIERDLTFNGQLWQVAEEVAEAV